MWRGRRDLLPWIVAISASILTEHFVPGKWYILVGGVLGAGCAAFVPDDTDCMESNNEEAAVILAPGSES
jgi:predicted branched-subunit amino acid permease